jgi:hypothetical protein
LAEARGRIKRYLESQGDSSYGTFLARIKMLEAPRPEAEPSARVAAVDGGIGAVELANGHRVIIARAAAVGPGISKRELIVDVEPVDSKALPWAYLTLVESLAATRAIQEGGLDYLLMDGSLYAKAIMLIHNLILTREFQALFYIPEFIAALNALAELVVQAEGAGVKLVFVSKDSRFKVLKEYAAFEALKGRIDDYIVERGLSWYSIMWLRRFRKELLREYQRMRGDYEAAAAFDLLFRQSVTDSAFLAGMAPRTYTMPMLLGACDAYMSHKGLTSVGKLRAAVRDRVEDALIFRREPRASLDEYAAMAERALSSLPKILLFYLKPAQGAEPLMVEVPLKGSRMFDGPSVKAFYPRAEVDDVVSLLLSQYRDEAHYNAWLYYAHTVASFKSSQLSLYAVYIRQMLGGAAAAARRVKMALGI